MASKLGSYAETAFSTSPQAHAKRRLLARSLLGNDDSVATGREIQESVRRAQAVREHVPPPKGVSLQDLEGLSMEEKATRMFPSMAEEARRKLGLAPYAREPQRTLIGGRR